MPEKTGGYKNPTTEGKGGEQPGEGAKGALGQNVSSQDTGYVNPGKDDQGKGTQGSKNLNQHTSKDGYDNCGITGDMGFEGTPKKRSPKI